MPRGHRGNPQGTAPCRVINLSEFSLLLKKNDTDTGYNGRKTLLEAVAMEESGSTLSPRGGVSRQGAGSGSVGGSD